MNWTLIIAVLLLIDIIFVIFRIVYFKMKSQTVSNRGVYAGLKGMVAPRETVFIGSTRTGKGKVYVTLACGAKILELQPHEIADTPGTIDCNQPESVRKGGVFFQCYGRCPYVYDCSYAKEFADLHLGKDFSLPLEHGKRLELKRRNGHRCIALVDESNVEVKTIPLTGVSYLGRAERYTTVPPLFQDVDEVLEHKQR